MHELFLSALAGNEDLQRNLRILQGYCGMKPVKSLRRRLIWEGPRTRTPKGFEKEFIAKQPPPKIPFWRSLGEQIGRQSYAITLLYDIAQDQFGLPEDVKTPSCDELFGTLRWSEIPDPGAKTFNSRPIIAIDKEQNLCTTLRSIDYRFVREVIQESYLFVRGEVVFEMSRYLQLAPDDPHTQPAIRSHLPTYESLISYDSDQKWILTAGVVVQNANDPEQMKKGSEELNLCKTEFDGCFDFKALDRHVFDTRVKIQGEAGWSV